MKKILFFAMVMVALMNSTELLHANKTTDWFARNKDTLRKVAAGVGTAALVGGLGYAGLREKRRRDRARKAYDDATEGVSLSDEAVWQGLRWGKIDEDPLKKPDPLL